MRRTMTPAVLKIVAAATAQTTPTAAAELREVARVFHGKKFVNTIRRAPSIDSLDLPPFRTALPLVGARTSRTIAVLLGTYRSDLSPHTSERMCFCMPDRSGDILGGHARSSRRPECRAPAGRPRARSYRCEEQFPCPERRSASSRARLSRAALEPARLRRIAAALSRALFTSDGTADFRAVLAQLPTN